MKLPVRHEAFVELDVATVQGRREVTAIAHASRRPGYGATALVDREEHVAFRYPSTGIVALTLCTTPKARAALAGHAAQPSRAGGTPTSRVAFGQPRESFDT